MSERSGLVPNRDAFLRAYANINYHKMSYEDDLVWKAFHKAKDRMCGQAAKKTIEVLEKHRRWGGYLYPSMHPFYNKIKGKGRTDDPEFYFYPYLLVLQAIWPDNNHVKSIAKAFARYWGVPDMALGPEHYPILNDKEREMDLFMGTKQIEYAKGDGERSAEDDAGNGEKDNEEEQGRDTIPNIRDIDTITDMTQLKGLKDSLEEVKKSLVNQLQEANEQIRQVQERERDYYRKRSNDSKKAAQRLHAQTLKARRIYETWAFKEKELTQELEKSSATPCPSPEKGTECPKKRRRVVDQESG